MASALIVELEQKIQHKIVVRDFGKVVAINITGDDTFEGTSSEWIFLSAKDYKKHMRADKNYRWVLSVPNDDILVPVSSQYEKHYLQGAPWEFDAQRYVSNETALRLLRQGKFQRFVYDLLGHDGYWYDVDRKPVWKHFWVEYTTINEQEYDVRACFKHLKGKDCIKELEICDIQWYSRDCYGNTGLQFYFVPTDTQFLRIWEEKHQGKTYEATRIVERLLCIKRFKKTTRADDG